MVVCTPPWTHANRLRDLTLAVTAVASISAVAHAQWDASSFALPGPSDKVSSLIMHDDGSGPALYVGGWFSATNGGPGCKIARWNGSEWSSLPDAFDGSFGSSVRALAEYQGDLIVGGLFSQPSSVANNIVRWTGTQWAGLGDGVSGNVESCVSFGDDLIVGGSFTTAGGQPAQRVARWNGTTNSWTAMPGLNGTVFALAVYNNELYAAGSFAVPSRVAKWNGTTWVAVGDGFNNTVRSLRVFGGELIAGGSFTASGTTVLSRIARLNGSTWEAFTTGVDAQVATLAEFEGKLAVGGQFTLAGATAASGFALWNGSAWEVPPGSPLPDIRNVPVAAILTVPATRDEPESLYVGGWFAVAGGQCASNVAKYSEGVWTGLGTCPSCQGLSGPVRAMVVHDDGSGEALFVAGTSKCFGSLLANNVARWNGSSWASLAGGMNGRVNELCKFGPDLVAGGSFTEAGSASVSNIARWDGATWHPLLGGVSGGVVAAMTVFDDGSGPALFVGGSFTSADGLPVNGLAKWNGSSWSDVGGGAAGPVLDMLVWDDGTGPSLVVAGKFASLGSGAGQISTRGIARWRNGQWSAIGPFVAGIAGVSGSSSYVKSLATWPPETGASLVCAGVFSTIGGAFTGPIAKWNGSAWQAVSPATSDPFLAQANAIFSYTNGTCNQLFTHAWFPDFMMGNWNGSTWGYMDGGVTDDAGVIWANLIGGASIEYAAFAMFQGKLVVAGDFTTVGGWVTIGGQPASNITYWDVEASLACLGDIDRDDAVNVNDLLAVISHWGACIDCPEDPTPCGGDGQVNVNDLLQVISQWGPCP